MHPINRGGIGLIWLRNPAGAGHRGDHGRLGGGYFFGQGNVRRTHRWEGLPFLKWLANDDAHVRIIQPQTANDGAHGCGMMIGADGVRFRSNTGGDDLAGRVDMSRRAPGRLDLSRNGVKWGHHSNWVASLAAFRPRL